MRFVIDTNIFISAALKADSSPRYAFRWIEQHGRVLKSLATEQELYRTLAKPKLAGLLLGNDFINRLTEMVRTAELIEVIEEIRVCRDPDDDKFLALAVNGRADMIVSGDVDLLALHSFRGIPILDPAAFVRGVEGPADR
jgi:putative PIN family toxin of toxin-antitoxin system